MAINTSLIAEKYRSKIIDANGRRLLMTDFRNTLQEKDLSAPPNCGGFGRIRHFRRQTTPRWPRNGLPIDPACKALNIAGLDMIRAQAFQTAACNWRCWYCFVPFDLLKADPRHAAWMTPAELVDKYLAEPDRPPMIDLTGGEPSLVPEWTLWMMQELKDRHLEHEVYLWSDDSLSNDFFWKYLSDNDRELIHSYPMYGRVCCFKGFDHASFAFNTSAEPALFDHQFDLFHRLLLLGIDMYAYVTFTSEETSDLAGKMKRFVDRLQAIHPNLPLRTVPLEISIFTPMQDRLNTGRREAIAYQYSVVDAWQREIETRFDASLLCKPVTDIPMTRDNT